MDVTSHLVTQAIFRLSFALCLMMSLIPVRLAPRGFLRGNLAILLVLNLLTATLVYFSDPTDDSRRLLLGLAVCLAAASGLGSAIWSPRFSSSSSYVIFVLGLLGFLAAFFACRWDADVTGLGMTLAVVDLTSSGLLLGAILSAVLLSVWHLSTPRIDEVPRVWLVRLVTLAVGTRALLAIIALAVQGYHGQATIDVSGFLVFRCVLPALGLWMLILLKRNIEDDSYASQTSTTLVLGLFLALIGELAAHLVPLEGLYSF